MLLQQFPNPGLWSFCPGVGHIPKEMEEIGWPYLGHLMELHRRVTLTETGRLSLEDTCSPQGNGADREGCRVAGQARISDLRDKA